jgi:hypothetical protein
LEGRFKDPTPSSCSAALGEQAMLT